MQHQMHNWEMAEDMRMQRERDPWAISIPPVIIEERVRTQTHMLLWQVRGRTELVIDGAKVQLIEGQAVWIPAGAPHSLTVAANSVLVPRNFLLARLQPRSMKSRF